MQYPSPALALGAFLLLASAAPAQSDSGSWSPAKDTLLTRWAGEVQPGSALPEYPRPQMVRPNAAWENLNGLWQYAVRPRAEAKPESWDGEILVPFAIESALSGVKRTITDEERLWYRRTFMARPRSILSEERILLHFGAVDWQADVWLNGKSLGRHEGGYDAFTFDVTDALTDSGPQELVVAVWDPTDKSYQPRGKQVSKPRGIWYTAVTGIWQTVWLETVPEVYVRSMHVVPSVAENQLRVAVDIEGPWASCQLTFPYHAPPLILCNPIYASGNRPQSIKKSTTGKSRVEFLMKLPDSPRLETWSPDSPVLHGLQVEVRNEQGSVLDSVSSYVGLRDIQLKKDDRGIQRLFLNGESLFQLGPLDQGWWPDGLYTAPTDEALRYDLEVTRALGFNMIRKHVKIEPARWYYHCDRLGLMVWQDMPSGDGYIGGNDPDLVRTPESEANYRREFQAMIDGLRNHPCIVAWVPFNEGWGQFKTEEITSWTMEYDPTRLVDGPSGWADRGVGHLRDMHSYPGPGMPPLEENRAAVLGEFGGLGLVIPGHLWRERDNWGYRSYDDVPKLTSAYLALLPRLHDLIGRGLAAAVYTQTTDVEGEVNGLMTYDRDLIKMNTARIREANRRLYGPAPTYRVLVPTSQKVAQTWRFVTEAPCEGWSGLEFDDGAWQEGPGVLGASNPPGAEVRTEWSTSDVWARRSFELTGELPGDLMLSVYHDEDAEIWLNGEPVAKLGGYVNSYVHLPIEKPDLLRQGRNVIAVHCRQTSGGQAIDVGIDVRE